MAGELELLTRFPGDDDGSATRESDRRPVTPDLVVQALFNSKRTRIFAESQVRGDGSDWTQEELRLLGDLSVAVSVAVYDDGRHHAEALKGIRAVWFDPYNECENEDVHIGHLALYVRPLLRNKPGLPQLSSPDAFARAAGDPAIADCDLVSVVAWDHVSWPGNDFFAGARSTDDGVKAAATDSMFALTGFRGHYNASTNTYDPPADVRTWEELVVHNDLRLCATNNVVVVGAGSGPLSGPVHMSSRGWFFR